MNFIYVTTNLINNKQYVGSHNGSENDSYLGSGIMITAAIKKYGKSNFKREILEECEPISNLILETKYIKEYNSLQPSGYNISPTGGHQINGSILKSTKIKMSEAKKGKKRKPFTDEHKKKIGAGNRGKTVINSLEARKKMSEAKKGKKRNPLTDEHKKKISDGNIGKNKGKTIHHTIEARKKMSESHKGKTHSESTKLKMSVSHKKNHKK